MTKKSDKSEGFSLHEWYYVSLLICFVGIVGCYSYYAYL